MKGPLFMVRFVLLLALTTLLGGCMSSAKHLEKALTYEQAHNPQQAYPHYLAVLQKKPQNIQAQEGIKRVGQQQIDYYLALFIQKRQENKHRKAVVYYDSAATITTQTAPYVTLTLPSSLLDAINDSRTRATTQYAEEKYQQGLTAFSNKEYRQAYSFFKQVIDTLPHYKDSYQKLQRSLELGKHHIAILTPAASQYRTQSRLVQSEIITQLLNKNDPFIDIIDRRHLETILKEQKLTYSGLLNDKSSVEAGDISGVSSIIYVEVLTLDTLSTFEKKATKVVHYIEPHLINRSYTDTSGTYINQWQITFQSRPATVYLFERQHIVNSTANYQIISVATSKIQESNNRRVSQTSTTTYAQSQGYDYRSLSTFVPNSLIVTGSEQIAISRQDQLIRSYNLPYRRSYFTAPQVPKDFSHLTSEALQQLSYQLAQDIYSHFNQRTTP